MRLVNYTPCTGRAVKLIDDRWRHGPRKACDNYGVRVVFNSLYRLSYFDSVASARSHDALWDRSRIYIYIYIYMVRVRLPAHSVPF